MYDKKYKQFYEVSHEKNIDALLLRQVKTLKAYILNLIPNLYET